MRIFHLMLALLVVIIWGCNFVTIKLALTHIPPLTLCTIRFFLASIPAVFLIKRPNIPFKYILAFGLPLFAIQSSLLFVGIYVGMPSGLASLLLHTQVFFTILLAVLFLGEQPHPTQILGAIIAFTGIALIASKTLNDHIPIWGFIPVILAAFSWGVGNIMAKKLVRTNILSLVIWGNFVTMPPLFIIMLFVEGIHPLIHVMNEMNLPLALTILYISYPTTVFAFIIWSFLLQEYNVATIAPFSLLVPVVGISSTSLFLNEPLYQWKILAALLIVSGLCINILGPQIMNRYKLREAED